MPARDRFAVKKRRSSMRTLLFIVLFAGLCSLGRAQQSFEFSWLPGDAAKPGVFRSGGAITVDASGNVYIADYSCIRKITPNGTASILAGDPELTGYADGAGSTARFGGGQRGIAVNSGGEVFMSDT